MARPKGARNKATEFIKPIAQRYGPDCIRAMVNILKNSRTKPLEKAKAAEVILAYGFGKPVESHEFSGPNGSALYPEIPPSVHVHFTAIKTEQLPATLPPAKMIDGDSSSVN
jgi:hypothetical protein